MACAKIGAVGVPAFSGYGSESLATRLQAAEAKVLVTVDSTTRRGKPVPMKEIADGAAASSPSVQHLVVIRASGEPVPMDKRPRPLVARRGHAAAGRRAARAARGAGPEPSADDHLHLGHHRRCPRASSTRTSAILLKAAIDFGYAFDLQPGDMLGWIADMGWMLGPADDRRRPAVRLRASSWSRACPTIPTPIACGASSSATA